MQVLQGLRSRWRRVPDAGPDRPDLSWVAEWAANVRDHVRVREEDALFIVRPNRAFKINHAAVVMLTRLFEGEPIEEILAPHGAVAWRDTERFLLDLRTMLLQGLPDTYESPAVDKEPFELAFSKYPVLSEVAVTYRCNAACVFCYAGCNCTVNPVGSEEEMSLAEVRRVLDVLAADAKVPSVSFTGGEATLRSDLPDMIRHARSLGLRVNLITNGIRCASERHVAELAEAGLHSAQVSIEGTTPEVHEAVTQVPGSFARATAGVRNLASAGLHVHTNTTILRTNVHDVDRFPRFVKERLGLDTFSMNLMIPTGSAPLNGELAVTYLEIGPILRRILARCREHGVELKWYSPTPACMFNTIVEGLGNKGCSACDGLVSVGADGQVLPCASYDAPLGSLLDRSFEEIWQGSQARSFRERAHAPPGCRECDQFVTCQGACPLYWRHQGHSELLRARAARADAVEGGAS